MIIAIPITLLLIYLAKYYTLKHEYNTLQDSWLYLIDRQAVLIKIIKDNGINTIEPKMSENEEANEKE